MTKTTTSDAEAARLYGEAYDWRGAVERYVFDKYAPKPRLERDTSQPIGIGCPNCGKRPALRHEEHWRCQHCFKKFTLTEVVRSLWKPKS